MESFRASIEVTFNRSLCMAFNDVTLELIFGDEGLRAEFTNEISNVFFDVFGRDMFV